MTAEANLAQSLSANAAAAGDLPPWLDLLAAALVLVGALFLLVGAIGLFRLPDGYTRLHAPTKATTLGVGGVLLASMAVGAWRGELWLHALLVTLFLFITAPVSANLIALALMHRQQPSIAGPAPDDPDAVQAPEPTAAETPLPGERA